MSERVLTNLLVKSGVLTIFLRYIIYRYTYTLNLKRTEILVSSLRLEEEKKRTSKKKCEKNWEKKQYCKCRWRDTHTVR